MKKKNGELLIFFQIKQVLRYLLFLQDSLIFGMLTSCLQTCILGLGTLEETLKRLHLGGNAFKEI